jgi:hypothetical protein
MKTFKLNLFLVIILLNMGKINAQKEQIAILNIDVKSISMDAISMGNLVRLEVEKTGVYSVFDKYDLAYITQEQGFDVSNCYGRICLVEAGELLGADKMLTGSVEKFDDKIIVILRLIDVDSGKIEKTDIMEYLDLPELQTMVKVSVNNLFGIENDPLTVNMLSSYEDPINTPKTQLRLNGPRMGVSYVGGRQGEILEAPENKGGFNGMPVTTLIGYQYELGYLSSGNFQALFEFIGLVGGLEQSRVVPSLTIMNGFRSNKNGFEFAFGPLIELTSKAEGFYNENGTWTLVDDAIDTYGSYEDIPYDIENRLDSRGYAQVSTSWVWAFGKTFRSGYLNIPVNVFFSHKVGGWVVGASFGFNVSKR